MRRSRSGPSRAPGSPRGAEPRAGRQPRIQAVPPPSHEEDSAWCVPAAELQDLVNFLASPGVLPVIARLASGPSPYRELLCACPSRPGVADDALTRLEAFGLVMRLGTPPHDWCSLTASGEDLLGPLAGFASWSQGRLRTDTD